ncbi:Coiled-coil domain-containing protein 3 [Aix galericulata]|nr:Coiled-coil domain-containing protein 3 [Aix galericulata]
MDENYILLPHGVNFQEAIFPDTQENRRMFASLFQFSNCSQAQHALSFSSDWEIQEDNRLMCSSVQKALFEEEDRVKKLQQKVATLEKRNKQLRDRANNHSILVHKMQFVLQRQEHSAVGIKDGLCDSGGKNQQSKLQAKKKKGKELRKTGYKRKTHRCQSRAERDSRQSFNGRKSKLEQTGKHNSSGIIRKDVHMQQPSKMLERCWGYHTPLIIPNPMVLTVLHTPKVGR